MSRAWTMVLAGLLGQEAPREDGSPPPGPALVRALCVSCHSAMVIGAARKSAAQWESTVARMEAQGMPPLPPGLRGPLVDFLSRNRGPRPEERPRGPWADARHANPLW